MPHILYDDPSSEVVLDDPAHHSWAPRGNPRADVGTSRTLINSGYTSGYVDYLFGGSSSGFLDNQ